MYEMFLQREKTLSNSPYWGGGKGVFGDAVIGNFHFWRLVICVFIFGDLVMRPFLEIGD